MFNQTNDSKCAYWRLAVRCNTKLIMTWRELKDFANSLPKSELEAKVILWREDEAITEIEAEQLDENHYTSDKHDEGCITESEALSDLKNNPEDYPNGFSDFTKVYDKGTPILHEQF